MNSRTYFLLCLLALAWPFATPAAEPPASLARTEITADSMESVSTDTETITKFTGNVTATGTNLRITCDRLEAVSVRLGDKTQIVAQQNRFKSIVATGRVKIVQGDREATCGRAVVLPGDDKITLTDKPMVVDHGADYIYTGDDLELLRGERRVQGHHVQINGPEIKDLGFDKNKKVELPATATPETK